MVEATMPDPAPGAEGGGASRPLHELRVGDETPDFCLPVSRDVGGEQAKTRICLHDFRGRQPVVLTFYQAAFTPI